MGPDFTIPAIIVYSNLVVRIMVREVDLLFAIWPLQFARYVAFGRYLNFSMDQFPNLLNEDKGDTYFIVFKRLKKYVEDSAWNIQ